MVNLKVVAAFAQKRRKLLAFTVRAKALRFGNGFSYGYSGWQSKILVKSQPTRLAPDREIDLFWNYLVNGEGISSPLADR